jgi:uncharacterized membrane protein
MNILTKIQLFMVAFLILLFLAVFFNPLLLFLAALVLCMQIFFGRSQLSREYPEDWKKYLFIFLLYEVMVMIMFLAITSIMSGGIIEMSRLYPLFSIVMILLLVTISLKFVVGRRHCFGTALFSTRDWVGVYVKSDLLSKISEGNYAVRNPKGLRIGKGGRLRVRVSRTGVSNYMPDSVEEVTK